MPPFSSAPFWSAAPERMLPVWPGWMPTPVACLLNRPLTTLILVLSGASGSRHGPAPSSSPEPLAHQLVRVDAAAHEQRGEPLRAAARHAPAIAAAPQTGTDSSQGRAIVTPTPRRKVRRVARDGP